MSKKAFNPMNKLEYSTVEETLTELVDENDWDMDEFIENLHRFIQDNEVITDDGDAG